MNARLLPLAENVGVPNTPWLPARRYPAALRGQSAAQVRDHLKARDWSSSWTGQIYDFHHDHSHAHEVIVVLRGQAGVILGGVGGPELAVGEGDVLLLPAVGHCSLHHSADFQIMGTYAAGRSWDICRPGETGLAWARDRMAEVPDWAQEPV